MKDHLKEEQIIDYLESGEISDDATKHLKECAECHRLKEELEKMMDLINSSKQEEPPESVKWAVDAAIYEELGKNKPQGTLHFSWLQVAASVILLAAGFLLGKGYNGNKEEVAALKEQVELLKEVTITSALKTHSASERIMAVNQVEKSNLKSNDKLIRSLIETVNTDESPNVRYEAVQALNKFIDQEVVRDELVKSLDEQEDPLIQMAMIQILVAAEEKAALEPLKKIIERDKTIPEVKKQAEIAIEILI